MTRATAKMISPTLQTPTGAIDFRMLAELISRSGYLTYAKARGADTPDAITALVNSPSGIAALTKGNGKSAADAALCGTS